ncbi:ABC transporter ATP-binding protein/permease [Clostridium senegalense]|uniref:ABC transporter ATP-binding protein n=1 Tax=Clostridium senegalense TaxID=1465809 RepID=UPI001C0FB6ED|nr:ABC transporter ATP-binding protein [Clostridium senegalense]MBU5227262.1 ABC transporter ATP-binding protein/permease [Clostridium senegalense]
MNFLNKYIKKYWKLFCIAIICLTLEAACDLMQPTIMSKIIDIGVKNKQMDFIFKMTILMLGITGLGALSAVSRNIISSTVSQKFGAELRYDLFKKVQSLSFVTLDKYDGASLVTRLSNDVTQVQNFVNGLMRVFVKAPLLCIGSIIMAINLNPSMSLTFIVVIPIVSIIIYMNMKIGYPFYVRIQKSLDKVNSVIREYLAGVRVVKAFNRFNYETERFSKSNEKLANISTKAMGIMSIFSPGITLTVNLGIVAIIWIGGIRVNKGNMEVGQIIAFINYMTQILFSLMMISFVFTMLVKAKASAGRIGEIFQEESDMNVKKQQTYNNLLKGKIDFENVSFSYSNDLKEPVLKNISFSCVSGETIGIIGSTGSGKSTIVNLIEGFYNVNSGNIRINNIDIKDIDLKMLREKVAIVPQNIILFSGSIIDNIRWGKENASYDEVEKAAAVSEAHEFIKNLPEGYDTILGQGGINLSGGQKQRISIARALIKRPEILILDDCTSAVDVVTEGKIREAIKNYSTNLTSIVIAQRITSVMDADKIIVIDNGSVVGIGQHVELMRSCKVYKEIFLSQVGKELV